MTKPIRKSRAKAQPKPTPQPVDPPNEEVWTTATGQRIKVGNMDADHCRNTLRLLLRRCRQGKLLTKRQAFLFVANTLQKATRGTMAEYLQHQASLEGLSDPANAKGWDSEEQF